MKVLSLSVVFFALASPFLFAVEQHAITFDDLIALARISDPQISPDGKWVVYVVQTLSEKENKGTSKLWIVAADGGGARQFTTGSGNDTHPRFSPDGSTIAFISDRDGSSQIWVIPVAGGEARKLSDIATEADGYEWSPAGDTLAFFSSVYAECKGDMDCNKKRKEEADKRISKARVIDRLPYRFWNRNLGETVSHLFVMPAKGGDAKELSPGDFPVPPNSFLNPTYEFNFSPDGKEICFAGKHDKDLAVSTNMDLFTVPVGGGEPANITAENKALDCGPLYSPDGRAIAYLSHKTPGYEADRYGLTLYDRETKAHRALYPGDDYSVSEFVFSPDGKRIYFVSEEAGYKPLFCMELDGSGVRKIVEKTNLRDIRISKDGTFLVAANESFTKPADVIRIDLPAGRMKALTQQNREILSGLILSPGEEFEWKGAEGKTVHGFLIKPPFFDSSKKYPLVVMIHGGPQGAFEDQFHYRWNAQMFASPGFVVFLPNFTGSTGYGSKFKEDISGDWGGKPYVDIMKGVDKAAELSFVDARCIGAAGGSFGGYMVDWIAGHTDRFKCLVTHSGLFDLTSMYGTTEELWFPEWDVPGTPWGNREAYRKLSPSEYVEKITTPMLVTHGEIDYRVSVSQAQELFTALQRRGIPSRLVLFPDEGHFILKPANARIWWREVLGWLEKYLK